jgi:hypothetical protein
MQNHEKQSSIKLNIVIINDMIILIITIAELQFGAINSHSIAKNMERIKYLRSISIVLESCILYNK